MEISHIFTEDFHLSSRVILPTDWSAEGKIHETRNHQPPCHDQLSVTKTKHGISGNLEPLFSNQSNTRQVREGRGRSLKLMDR